MRFLRGAARLTWWLVVWFILTPIAVLLSLLIAIVAANVFDGLVPVRGLPILFTLLGFLIVLWIRQGPRLRRTDFKP